MYKFIKSHFLSVTTLLIGAVFLFISCSKELTIDDVSQNKSDVLLRSSNQIVINGMLHFDSYKQFEQYIEELKIDENDSEQVTQAYSELGVDLSSDYLPNLTFFPVSLRQEQLIEGFTSARKLEEDIINNAFERGDDSINSIIENPFLKSVLNSDYSVHIGSRIFKFFDNGGIVIILDNNWTAFDSVKNLDYGDIRYGKDIIVTSEAKIGWENYYTIDSNNQIIDEKDYSVRDSIIDASRCDWTEDFVVTQLNDGTVRFDLPTIGVHPGWIFFWSFGNNQFAVGHPLTIDCSERGYCGSVDLTVTAGCPECPSGFVKICVARVEWECVCGERNFHDERWESFNAGGSGRPIRIDAAIWVNDGAVGCRSNLFGRRLGIWLPLNLVHNTNGVCVDIGGNIIEELNGDDCEMKECNDLNVPLTTQCLQGGQSNQSITLTIPQTGEIYSDPGNLSSGHRARLSQGGTWFGFGIDRPRLVLP